MTVESMSGSVGTVLVILLANSFLVSFCHHEVCVATNNDSKGRHCEVFTLDEFCMNTTKVWNDEYVTFLGDNHNLSTNCVFNGTKNLTLKGQSTIIKCSSNQSSGFIFNNVSALMIYDITFIGCGASWTITELMLHGLYSNISSALLFFDGSDHTLTNVTVLVAKSAGIYIYNVAGEVILDYCKIKNASSSEVDPLSGNIIAYGSNVASHSNLAITNSTFTGSGYRNIYKKVCARYGIFSSSSGLTMLLGSPLVEIAVMDSNFSNNMGCSGGNMAVLFYIETPVSISNVVFAGGISLNGGGLYVSFVNSFLSKRSNIVSSGNSSVVLRIINSMFVGNCALKEGGGVYMQWRQTMTLRSSSQVEVVDSTFTGNFLGSKGSGGLAFHYKTYQDTGGNPYSFPLFHVTLNITNCTFSHHYPNISSSQLQSESSVVIAANVPYLGINGITVESNNCTGILAIASTLVFYNFTTLQNNTALTGGGIRLCSSSTMYLTPYSSVIITNNSVQQTGGGMQVYSNCLISKPACFYQYYTPDSNFSLLSTVNFTVKNNHALNGGDNIYGGLITHCYFLLTLAEEKQFPYHHLLQATNNTIHQPSSISSDPQHVCFNHFRDYVGHFYCNKNVSIVVYPGEKVTFPVRVVGQMDGTVSGAVKANASQCGFVIEDSEKVQTVRFPGENITYTVYSSHRDNFCDDHVTIKLTAALHSDASVLDYSEQFSPAIIHVHFMQCPFGFIKARITTYQYSCKCAIVKNFVISCSIQNQTITKPAGSWIGTFKVDNQTFLALNRHCPFDYCNNSIQVIKSNAHNLSQDEQCQYNRTGILCGSCPTGWSLVLGSSECRKNCSNLWLFLIIPFALAGLLLVVVIHFLNLTVTMGTVCGLIFYANVIQDHAITLLSTQRIPVLTEILLIFLSWLNLDLGITTCFYHGMNAFGKTILQFAFPIYIWFISAMIVFLSRRYISFTRVVGENAVKVLSTLFLLSYSKMIRITLTVFNLKYLTVHINSSVSIHKVRWILDGNIAYFSFKHIVLFVIAALFVMLLLPFTFSLLCIRRFYSLSSYSRHFSWVDKLKPFFDAYTGPFKDEARFWTGLLFLIRLFFVIVYILDFVDDATPYCIIVVVCLFLLAFMAYLCGVYKRKILNALELFSILNMGIIFLLWTYKSNSDFWISISTHVLVSSAFLVFLGIVLSHAYLKFSNYTFMRRLVFWHRNREMNLVSFDVVRDSD